MDRFYYRIEKARLSIKPEDYAARLNNGDDLKEDCPYGENYEVEPIKFVGENTPSKAKKNGRKRSKKNTIRLISM